MFLFVPLLLKIICICLFSVSLAWSKQWKTGLLCWHHLEYCLAPSSSSNTSWLIKLKLLFVCFYSKPELKTSLSTPRSKLRNLGRVHSFTNGNLASKKFQRLESLVLTTMEPSKSKLCLLLVPPRERSHAPGQSPSQMARLGPERPVVPGPEPPSLLHWADSVIQRLWRELSLHI